MKYGNETLGRIEAVFNRITQQAGEDGIDLLLDNKLLITKKQQPIWREEDGVIFFSVTSDGTTGPEWIKRLEGGGFRLNNYAKAMLRHPDFQPTSGITTEITVLKGKLFPDDERITSKIRAKADKSQLSAPNAEVACLIRENFSDEDIEAMGLIWIVTMHEPINDSAGGPNLLGANRHGVGRWLYAYWGRPDDGWHREYGFAFLVSQACLR